MVDLFYFQVAGARLFAAWHPPRRSPSIDAVAVFCSPFGREIGCAQVLERRISEELALRGVGALRFDYFGTGDSEGCSTEADLDRWLLDVAGAVNEGRQRSGAHRVCLLGVRLGALVAARYTERDGPVSAFCAIDPISSGPDQISQMEQVERQGWADLGITPDPDAAGLVSVLGMSWTRSFVEDLAGLDIDTVHARPAEHVGVFLDESSGDSSHSWLRAGHRLGGFDRMELGTQIRPTFYDAMWPPGLTPRLVSEWLETVVA